MPHKRSRKSIEKRRSREVQSREAARIVSHSAIRDLSIKESINIMTPGLLALRLQKRLGYFDAVVASRYDVGEVLSDAYARGSLQRIEADDYVK